MTGCHALAAQYHFTSARPRLDAQGSFPAAQPQQTGVKLQCCRRQDTVRHLVVWCGTSQGRGRQLTVEGGWAILQLVKHGKHVCGVGARVVHSVQMVLDGARLQQQEQAGATQTLVCAAACRTCSHGK